MRYFRKPIYYSQRRRSQRGFSLTEIIVAAIITVLIAQATAAALILNTRIQSDAIDETTFLNIVNQDIEQARAAAIGLCRQGNNTYGNVGACDPSVNAANALRTRCDSTTQNAGLGNLLANNLPAFASNTITDNNGVTVTVSRNPNPQPIRPAGALSFSTLQLQYSATVTTGNNRSRSLTYITEIVPTAVGWCSVAS